VDLQRRRFIDDDVVVGLIENRESGINGAKHRLLLGQRSLKCKAWAKAF
jgi:hypothetical protein